MSSAMEPDKDKAAKDAASRANARAGDHFGEGADTPAWAEGLKQLYDSVVEEPLPDAFKDLLDAFDESTGPGEDDAGTGKPS